MTPLADRQKEFCSALMIGAPEWGLTGLPMRSAAAIGGNATRENRDEPVTTGPKDHGSDGTLQWRVERLDGPDGLKAWCSSKGVPWNTLRSQALFTLHELTQPRYAVLRAELEAGSKSLETMTLNFCDAFERPSGAGRVPEIRIQGAHDCLSILMRDVPAPPVIVTTPLPTIPVTLPPIGSLQMPIEIILQLIAPLAQSLVSGLLGGVLSHIQQNGVAPSPLHPAGVPATKAAPAPAPLPIDFAALEPLIAKLISDQIAKLGKPA